MKLELRVAWITVAFTVLFGSLFTRLWFVQVAAGATYEAASLSLQLDEVPTQAARGTIVDAQGRTVASTQRVAAVVVDRRLIPTEEEDGVIQELSGLLGERPQVLASRFDDAGSGTRFVLGEVERSAAYFILTHRDRFTGVSIEYVDRREYPEGNLMAHVLGYVGTVSEEDLERNSDLLRTGTAGRAGVERQYDDFLQGTPGRIFYQVRPSGAVEGGTLPEKIDSVAGNTVVLSLDLELQRQAEASLQEGIEWARDTSNGANAEHGALVVLNAKTGEVLAMASFPTFSPDAFVLGISQSEFDALLDSFAFNNLAIQGQLPPGSTFKGITYATAIEEGFYALNASHQTPEGSLVCDGVLRANSLDQGDQQIFRDHGHGTVDLHTALGASCNIYFWQVALAIWNENKNSDDEDLIQEWARRVGLGDPTGIDLPFEAAGQIPDRQLFERWAEESPNRLHPERLDPGPIWKGGDVMNVSIGQGEVLTTPLQMAVAYAALTNGGTVWRPTVVDRVETPTGELIEDFEPSIARTIDWSPTLREFMLEDLGRVTNSESGTARRAFSVMDNRFRVGGKTGTATGTDKADTSWFVGVAPLDDPAYIVSVVVEEGGNGGDVAAPIARQILQYLLGETVDSVRAGL